MSTSNDLKEVRRLNENETRRLFRLLQMNPTPQQLWEFASSCQAEETSPTSTSRKIQNSQLCSALSLMSWRDLKNLSGEH